MILFQGKRQVSELNVVRDEFNKTEARKVRITQYIIWFNAAFQATKIIVPTATLISCSSYSSSVQECTEKTDNRIHMLLISDIVYMSLLTIYIIYCTFMILCMSWKYSRLEARKHFYYFAINSFGLIAALFFILNNLTKFFLAPEFYITWRIGYYYDWIA